MRTETGRTLQQLKRIAPAIVTPMLEWFMKRYFLGSNGSWNEAGMKGVGASGVRAGVGGAGASGAPGGVGGGEEEASIFIADKVSQKTLYVQVNDYGYYEDYN